MLKERLVNPVKKNKKLSKKEIGGEK